MKRLQGIGASSGYGHAKSLVLEKPLFTPDAATTYKAAKEHEILTTALAKTEADLKRLEEITATKVSPAAAEVFGAHLLMLLDPSLTAHIKQLIDQGHQALYAVIDAQTTFYQLFASMDDAYMKERAQDILDITNRLATYVSGGIPNDLALINEPVVLIAHDLGPSDTAVLNPEFIKAFVTEIGGRTSHTAIIARSLEIPAVVGCVNATKEIQSGQIVVVDGSNGEVASQPDASYLASFDQKAKAYQEAQLRLAQFKTKDTLTQDGKHVELAANIGSIDELEKAVERATHGVGLFRTELLFLSASSEPTEAQQVSIYERAVELAAPHKVIFRTLDIGGDKVVPYLNLPQEDNPFLGVRGIRLNLKEQVLFRTQLRALLQASAKGPLRIMFPMIATVEELQEAKDVLHEEAQKLQAEGKPVGDYEVGVMIEIPAAAVAADMLAPHVDFFSIGTNDLIQYTMAADRMNQGVKHLYQPYHPAVIRLISMTIDASHRHGKWTGMCGSMAGETEATKLLLALGLDEFSVSIASLLEMRAHIASIDTSSLTELKEQILRATSTKEILDLLQ